MLRPSNSRCWGGLFLPAIAEQLEHSSQPAEDRQERKLLVQRSFRPWRITRVRHAWSLSPDLALLVIEDTSGTSRRSIGRTCEPDRTRASLRSGNDLIRAITPVSARVEPEYLRATARWSYPAARFSLSQPGDCPVFAAVHATAGHCLSGPYRHALSQLLYRIRGRYHGRC